MPGVALRMSGILTSIRHRRALSGASNVGLQGWSTTRALRACRYAVSGGSESCPKFPREEFALKQRYAFVLHTDEPHPRVHAVFKGGKRIVRAVQHPQGDTSTLARGVCSSPKSAGCRGKCDRACGSRPVGQCELDSIFRAMVAEANQQTCRRKSTRSHVDWQAQTPWKSRAATSPWRRLV